jgi:FdhD protein
VDDTPCRSGTRHDRDQCAAPAAVPRQRSVPIIRVQRGQRPAGPSNDSVAVEEPLEVRLHGKPFAVIMRTPGDDRALAAGFLLSEGVIARAAEIGAVEHCRHPDHPDVNNVVDVYLFGDAARTLDDRLAERRNVVTSSSCGMCGRVTIDSLRMRAEKLPATWTMTKASLAAMPERLREHQAVFDGTGGLHAAGLFTREGCCERSAEDVGRHNAVDKVIGAMLLDERLPLSEHCLMVSGRVSFEIVQKAWIAGIGLVCAVSAPSSLAIDLAEEAGITLLGFARHGGFNAYTHVERLPDVGNAIPI